MIARCAADLQCPTRVAAIYDPGDMGVSRNWYRDVRIAVRGRISWRNDCRGDQPRKRHDGRLATSRTVSPCSLASHRGGGQFRLRHHCGWGLVVFNLARTLLQNGHEVTIIEQNPDTHALVSQQIDCPVLIGDGSSTAVLGQAGLVARRCVRGHQSRPGQPGCMPGGQSLFRRS